ncbi:DUF4405 domain-containing protein [Pseudooceanicola nanhaiensis]|uniref:DUF4405 domain-containing protein n=1 Tax=Pseudooceanicola nanhaiensis TaxID=375761 RepID=UPI001CD5C22E|nr:DUF4405 domain-containing protein [Pseudooceanicola nanhaiensis]MCA0919201.1 DUF4405 domain-containing protein [Pseudooceanicola nanhaiensis]
MSASLNLRKWATPLTAATFLIVAVTGVVLFFHTGGTLSRVAHEWIGFAVMAAAGFHIAMNWRPLKGYFRKPLAVGILAAGVLATVITSINLTGAEASGVNPGMMFRAFQDAPLSAVAQVIGKTPEALVASLQAQGFDATPETSISQMTGNDRALNGQALQVAFARD